MSLTILNRQRRQPVNTRLLRKITADIFTELGIADAELGIVLVGAKAMARVNWQFLQHEGSTDVITFDHREPAPAAAGAPLQIHGELYICVDDAISQAKQFGTTWQSELVRYVVHGILHLLGYDDLKPDLRRTMKREENRLVRRLEKRFLRADPYLKTISG